MAVESFVQVAPDSVGKRIRNVQADVVQPDGTLATVQMQVVALADERGQLVGEPVDREWQAAVLGQLRAIRRGLEALTGQLLSTEGD